MHSSNHTEAPVPHQPVMSRQPLVTQHHHARSNHTHAPQYLTGHQIRLQAQQAGAQNAFTCQDYWPGRESYQPVSDPAPRPHHLPDILTPGKRAHPDTEFQRPSIQREHRPFELDAQAEVFELEAKVPCYELEAHVPTRTSSDTASSTSKRLDSGQNSPHTVAVVDSSSLPMVRSEVGEFFYLSGMITSGHAVRSTPSSASASSHA